MIETIVLNWLSEYLDVPIKMENCNEAEYVLVEKTGSSGGYAKSSTITIQSYAESLYQAALLNEQVKEAMECIITIDSISKCELNSDYNFTDTETKQYRYQAVFDLIHY